MNMLHCYPKPHVATSRRNHHLIASRCHSSQTPNDTSPPTPPPTPSPQPGTGPYRGHHSIEDLRRELEQSTGQPPFSITRTIQWLGEAMSKKGTNGGSLALSAYRWALGLDQPPTWGASWHRPRDVDAAALVETEKTTPPELLDAIQHLLMIPRSTAIRVVYRCPSAGAMPAMELMRRLVDLKDLFPGSNVARMVELLPSAFLGTEDWEGVVGHVRRTSEMLRSGLHGADLDAMFERDPTILFESVASMEVGLRRLRELWSVDAAALKNSDPEELALAVRALGLNGPPKTV